MRPFLLFILLVTLIPFGLAQKAEPPTNFVLIFADDQGYGDVGVYGAKGFTTPNIDRLAAEGMRFTDFYSAQAVCSASRAALMTGCYPNRIGIKGALGPRAKVGIHPNEETIAEVLRRAGYATGIFGKWHLGHRKEFLPLQHGFDEFLGLPYSNDMWPVGYDGKPLTSGWKSKNPQLPLIDGNEKVAEIRTLADQDTLTTRYTERAVQFIHKNKARPFFLYMPHTMPHVPLGVSSKFRGKSQQGPYGDVIMEIDWSVGQVLKALDAVGVSERTLVIYTSDNGPWKNYGKHAGTTGGLREGKGTSFEGGQREPCVMRWPSYIKAGRVCENIASTLDILPTLAAITGTRLGGNRIDGVDLTDLLVGRKGANPRTEFLFYYHTRNGDQLQAVRKGRWKLHMPHSHRSYVGVTPGKNGYPGPYAKGRIEYALFDLRTDRNETKDVKSEHLTVVNDLKALAQAARRDLGDAKLKGSGIRPPGRVK